MTSVDFVQDYVQLAWKDSCLTAYTMPILLKEGSSYGPKNMEYESAMYGLEGQLLLYVEVVSKKAINFLFKGAFVSISLCDGDYVTAEAILYRGADGQLWIV